MKFAEWMGGTIAIAGLAMTVQTANAQNCDYYRNSTCVVDTVDIYGTNYPPNDGSYDLWAVGGGRGGGGGGSSPPPGYSGPEQVIAYVAQYRQYCRPATQTCSTWASLASQAPSSGGYDICAALATPGSLGNNECQNMLFSIYAGVPQYTWVCAQVGC
jgi:hypothetical protein